MSKGRLLLMFSRRASQWALVFAAPLMLLGGMPGCKTVSSLDAIQQKQTLTIATRTGPTTYYESKYGPTGFEYALAQEFADSLGVQLEIRTAYHLDDLFGMLSRNQVDIAAAGLTATSQRARQFRFSLPYFQADQLVVYREGTLRPRKMEQLAGRDILVQAGSSHAEMLRDLARRHDGIEWRESAELETLDLLDMVERGQLTHTVVDSNEFEVHKAYFPRVRVAFTLNGPEPVGWALAQKPTDDELYDAVNDFFTRIREDGTLNMLKERYYGHTTHAGQGDSLTFNLSMKRRFPQYEAMIKEIARQESLDWRLLAAISYRESHWNPKAISPTGVRGMMMLTQTTAKEMGVTDRLDVEQSLRGGARYFKKIHRRIPRKVGEPDRTWFALAAYNVGMGHLRDAQALTRQQGGNGNKWSDVMQRLPLLQQRAFYKKTRYGYARGMEAVIYVQHIRSYYNLLDWQQVDEYRRKPPTRVAQHVPEGLQDMAPLTAL